MINNLEELKASCMQWGQKEDPLHDICYGYARSLDFAPFVRDWIERGDYQSVRNLIKELHGYPEQHISDLFQIAYDVACEFEGSIVGKCEIMAVIILGGDSDLLPISIATYGLSHPSLPESVACFPELKSVSPTARYLLAFNEDGGYRLRIYGSDRTRSVQELIDNGIIDPPFDLTEQSFRATTKQEIISVLQDVGELVPKNSKKNHLINLLKKYPKEFSSLLRPNSIKYSAIITKDSYIRQLVEFENQVIKIKGTIHDKNPFMIQEKIRCKKYYHEWITRMRPSFIRDFPGIQITSVNYVKHWKDNLSLLGKMFLATDIDTWVEICKPSNGEIKPPWDICNFGIDASLRYLKYEECIKYGLLKPGEPLKRPRGAERFGVDLIERYRYGKKVNTVKLPEELKNRLKKALEDCWGVKQDKPDFE